MNLLSQKKEQEEKERYVQVEIVLDTDPRWKLQETTVQLAPLIAKHIICLQTTTP